MNAFIRPLTLGDLDGPSLAIEDTIPVAGLKTVLAADAVTGARRLAHDTGSAAATRVRSSTHAAAVRRALACGWHIDTRVGHGDFGAAAAVSNAWVQAALASDFTGGLRVGAALYGICGFKPTHAAFDPLTSAAHAAASTAAANGAAPSAGVASLPMYCIGALAPDMQTLVDLAASLDDRFDETLAACPAEPVRVGWLASDGAEMHPFKHSYLSAKDWSKVHALLVDACIAQSLEQRDAADPRFTMHASYPSRTRTVRLPGLTDAAAAAALIARFAGRGHEARDDAPSAEILATALRHTRAFRHTVDTALQDVDVLALPTLPTRCAENGDLDLLTRVFNLTGHPALTLPFVADDGRLRGLQLIARHGDDARLCAAGRWFEDLFARHPAAQRLDAAVLQYEALDANLRDFVPNPMPHPASQGTAARAG